MPEQFEPGKHSHQGEKSHNDQSGNEQNPFLALYEQDRPEVLELTGVLYDAYTVQQSLEHAATTAQRTASDFPPHSREQYGPALRLDPPFAERYRRGSLFVASAVHVLRGSFTAYPEDPDYLRATVDAAFAPYGYRVGEGNVPDVASYTVEYSLGLHRQMNRYAELGRGKYISPKLLDFSLIADQWKARGQWQEEPEVTTFAEQLTKLQQLRLQISSTGIMLRHFRRAEDAANIPGLHPYYRELVNSANVRHFLRRNVGFWREC